MPAEVDTNSQQPLVGGDAGTATCGTGCIVGIAVGGIAAFILVGRGIILIIHLRFAGQTVTTIKAAAVTASSVTADSGDVAPTPAAADAI